LNTQFPRFDLYRELGIDPAATQEEITLAWRTQVEEARAGGPAAQRIQRLNTAQQWLADPARRAQYDREVARRARAGASAQERQSQRTAGAASRPTRERARGTVRSGSAGSPPWLLLIVGAVAILVFVVGVLRPFDGGDGAGGPGPSAAPTGTAAGSSRSPYGDGTCPSSQPPALAAGETRTVTMETELGTIVMKLEANLSPIAVGNFVALAECEYYDGIVFHRVVREFVIQGGDPDGTGTGGPGYTIQDEPVTATYSRGTVAMARSSGANSVGSQFFIVLDDRAREALADPRYNNYQIIGTVTSGMETADAITAAADGENPSDPVAMTKVTVSNP
jgi:cyclophilin family peptidyl-prolyl cis-trans isomerase